MKEEDILKKTKTYELKDIVLRLRKWFRLIVFGEAYDWVNGFLIRKGW